MGGASVSLADLAPVRTDRGVTLATVDGRVRVDLVEHLLAAIGGLGITRDLYIEPSGGELPLLDGGCARFADALEELRLVGDDEGPPRLRVLRDATFEHGISRYELKRGDRARVRVEIDFPPPVGRQRASWDGDPTDFRARIAPARTFGWSHEAEALRAAGRAGSVDLASVLVLDDHGPVAGCMAAGEDEPARHKLLDLVGDFALRGGPAVGTTLAFAPGHTANHAVLAWGLAEGVLG
jgi:UDP-3-O-[3-hydroxymyristoyl] N-acetylglucosamine deacetylase